ncbi:hypothetical protein N473_02670 [Pseudoalteromonas luteoviolacea CPMOR-1]|uniref:Uncharacterized protein n=1 Tax=Pseudoalteromonas luteoviolacea CPMOR-1 TaxID=1365248 RepID=A0A161Y0D0_9GAMM|nr:hypothetical protein [Pseudoalteromonas luteoviolacea]KZN59836.1 hypothetical protein N473_02670 [Pseudoalteromonas luteoviolacea CPMOR-1]
MENSTMHGYQIIDEPRSNKLSHTTVDPMWPLLGFMLGGPLFSWAWSALNSFALNSPSRNKELVIIGSAFISFFALYTGVSVLQSNGAVSGINPQYINLFIISIELVFCYKIFLMQKESFDIYEYFDGKVATPVFGLFLALFFGKKLEVFAITHLLTGAQ